MAVRPDEATARFDAAVADAVATNRLDAETARALRWWQRASVRAAEAYAATIARGVFTLTDDARAAAAAETSEATASWQRSVDVRAANAANAADVAHDAHEAHEAHEATAAPPPAIETRLQAPIVELAAVRLLAKDPRAVKSALAWSTDAPPTPQPADLTATTVTTGASTTSTTSTTSPTSPTSTPAEGKDRSHAHPASTA